MSITRDRELADLLYNRVNHLSQLQDDLNVMNSHHQGHQTELTLGENKQGLMDVPHETKDETPEMKALADALKKVAILHRQQEQLIKLLIQNHTDASSILNEFEKIRTAKLLNSEVFTLSHLINPSSH